ncbi:MAG: PLP-dependent lyase/thiolase [Candidatus Taylorbacteria bacterium]
MTPLEKYPELAKALGLRELYFKREDLHPYGSHKGRSIPAMIDHYMEQGSEEFVISSSGNAALAAALYIEKINSDPSRISSPMTLDIFVGNHIAPHKLEKLNALEDDNISVLIKERPLQSATLASQVGAVSLRQSTDDTALLGYGALARELGSTKGIGAIFMGTSSGTTAQALAMYFTNENQPVQIHIVQTSSCHPIADGIETFDGENIDSIADAIVDRTAMRKSALIPLIKKTAGHSWVASNVEIIAARDIVRKHTGLEISTNSALSVVGAMQSAYRGWEINGAVVCMICGE